MERESMIETRIFTGMLWDKVNGVKTRSQWDRGVKMYMQDMVTDLIDWTNSGLRYGEMDTRQKLKKVLMNGCKDMREFSVSGTHIWADEDIVNRLCTASEKKRCWKEKDRCYVLPNNPREHDWFDVQGRACYQAMEKLLEIAGEMQETYRKNYKEGCENA